MARFGQQIYSEVNDEDEDDDDCDGEDYGQLLWDHSALD